MEERCEVTFWIKEQAQEVDMTFYFDSDGLYFDDFYDACRRAALAFGYPEETVNKYFNIEV